MWLVGDVRYRRRSVLGMAAALAASRVAFSADVKSAADRIVTGSLTADGAITDADISARSVGNTLQFGGSYIGCSPSAATQLMTEAVGVPYGTNPGGTGRATVGCRIRIQRGGTVTWVSPLIRMNRPWRGETDSSGSYSIGDGGVAEVEVRKVVKNDPNDPDTWKPDLSSSGLLGVTKPNGQTGIAKIRDKYLEPYLQNGQNKSVPMWAWELQDPITVNAGDLLFLICKHVGSSDVDTRFTVNCNGLWGSITPRTPPYGEAGPAFGDDFVVMRSVNRTSYGRRHLPAAKWPAYVVGYSDGYAEGYPFECGNSGSRAKIGSNRWARSRFRIPSRYPTVTVDQFLVNSYRNVSGAGDLLVELRDSAMTMLASAAIAGSRFPVGVPSRNDSADTNGYWASAGISPVTISPGTYYFVVRSTNPDEYIFQGHAENVATLLQNMGALPTPTLIDVLDDTGTGFRLEGSVDGGGTWTRDDFKAGHWAEQLPVLLRVAGG